MAQDEEQESDDNRLDGSDEEEEVEVASSKVVTRRQGERNPNLPTHLQRWADYIRNSGDENFNTKKKLCRYLQKMNVEVSARDSKADLVRKVCMTPPVPTAPFWQSFHT
jgi:hypothetical protein